MIQAEAQSDAQVEDQKTEPQVEPDEKVPDEDDLPDDRCMLDEGDSLLLPDEEEDAWKKMLLEEDAWAKLLDAEPSDSQLLPDEDDLSMKQEKQESQQKEEIQREANLVKALHEVSDAEYHPVNHIDDDLSMKLLRAEPSDSLTQSLNGKLEPLPEMPTMRGCMRQECQKVHDVLVRDVLAQRLVAQPITQAPVTMVCARGRSRSRSRSEAAVRGIESQMLPTKDSGCTFMGVCNNMGDLMKYGVDKAGNPILPHIRPYDASAPTTPPESLRWD